MAKLNHHINESIYCIFEGRFKALTKEDIDIYLKSKKYNL